jgi:hypothetical protein
MMPRSAAFNARFPRSRSIQGAPASTKRKQGVNVTHVVTTDPATPASSG